MIFYGKQSIDENDIDAVVEVLKSDFLTQGPAIEKFEKCVAEYCGADVDFVDIDPSTYNMSIAELEKKLQAAEIKPRVVVPVHLAGQSCEMDKIYKLSQKYGF